MAKKFFKKIIYLGITCFIFKLLWSVTGGLWEVFVPWNYRTDLIAVIFVVPVLIVVSFLLSSLCFKVIRDTE
ncbi:hypothetical protein Pryu01_01163 [Paraliobacillus ryukyuensis]|uniref:Inhibitor of the pro-sigma K processing machinery n=1 Tax=Paraliobacillus ryukyuensis TaxID=200904 RepID=A0A366EFP0_9BACI|nr:inhibitor of the pro-sigma K processing machinery [Paraliobacillus ryukyuensis]